MTEFFEVEWSRKVSLRLFSTIFSFVLAAAKLVGNMRHFGIEDVDEPSPEDIRLDISS